MNDFIEVTVAAYYEPRAYDVGSTVYLRKRDVVSLEKIIDENATYLILMGAPDYLKVKEQYKDLRSEMRG